MPDCPVYRVAAVRDSLEDVDERLDRAVRSPGIHSISDWYLSGGSLLLTPEAPEPRRGRWLDCERSSCRPVFWTQLDMFALDIEMLNLRKNVKEALIEEVPEYNGRLVYGGGQWNRIGAR
jgi:hypothetical protein